MIFIDGSRIVARITSETLMLSLWSAYIPGLSDTP